MSLKNQLLSLVLPVVPKNDLSRLVGRVVHRPLPGWVGRKSVEWFARYYNINMDEAELPMDSYKSIGDLFTRRLRSGARPISGGIVHPADGRLTSAGVIEKSRCLQAKEKDYSVAEFVRSSQLSAALEGGTFFTYYLCPTDYHRVHSPVDGKITSLCHVPGEMWPVNDWSVSTIANLFSLNERVIVQIETPKGRCVLVMVAATNVGNMTMSFDESVRTNVRLGSRAVREKSYQSPHPIRKGDEVGIFHMGSTVVMLYEKGMIPPSVSESVSNQPVKLGETLYEGRDTLDRKTLHITNL